VVELLAEMMLLNIKETIADDWVLPQSCWKLVSDLLSLIGDRKCIKEAVS